MSSDVDEGNRVNKRATLLGIFVTLTAAANAGAVTSAEIYTSEAYQYGRFSARIQYAPGSGVVSSFFLWKDGSEKEDVFWNELDFEKLEAECRVETNTIFGNPEGIDPEKHELPGDLCGEYHVYTYEWTPEYISWLVDGVEIRRDTGDTAAAFKDNATEGMQLRFNVWPGDETFGGAFDPSILPVYEYIDWVEYSSYADGAFQVEWREDFTAGTLPSGWLTASWDSPKGLSTHARANVGFQDGYVVLALTADDATGTTGANPKATDTEQPTPVDPTSSAPSPGGTTTGTETTAAPVSPAPSGSGDPNTTAPGVSTTDDDAAGCSCKVGASKSGNPLMPLLASIALAGIAAVRRVKRRNA
jgi:MYXO-CTERM domain-containing protein